MRKYFLVLILILPFALPANAYRFDASDKDKQLHFLASYAINTTILAASPKDLANRRLKAAAITAGVGLVKELADSQFSRGDFVADYLGILVSTGVSIVFEF